MGITNFDLQKSLETCFFPFDWGLYHIAGRKILEKQQMFKKPL